MFRAETKVTEEKTIESLFSDYTLTRQQLQKLMQQSERTSKTNSAESKSPIVATSSASLSPEIRLHNEFSALEAKFHSACCQIKKVENSIHLLNQRNEEVEKAIESKADLAFVRIKSDKMDEANDAMREEFKALKPLLPFPSFEAIKVKIAASVKELSSHGSPSVGKENLENTNMFMLKTIEICNNLIRQYKPFIRDLQGQAKMANAGSYILVLKQYAYVGRTAVTVHQEILKKQKEENLRQMKENFTAIPPLPLVLEAKRQFILNEITRFSENTNQSADEYAAFLERINTASRSIHSYLFNPKDELRCSMAEALNKTEAALKTKEALCAASARLAPAV